MRLGRSVLLTAASALTLTAQEPSTAGPRVSVRADNDAFNFWQAPWSRPDEEYTSGVRLVVDDAKRSFAFGQDIYTAAHRRDQPDAPGARPDAGVLWAAYSRRRDVGLRTDERGLIIGVTGRAALAEPMQRFFHGLAPGWNKPINWSRQLPGEPVFGATWDSRWRAEWRGLQVARHAGASVGTLLTEARGGVGGEWSVSRWFALTGDAGLHLVARNEVLSGTIFRSSDHVTLRPIVGEWQLGGRTTYKAWTLIWSTHWTGAEYTTRSRGHQWSSLALAWQRSARRRV